MKIGDLVKVVGEKPGTIGTIVKEVKVGKSRMNGKIVYLSAFYDVMWDTGEITSQRYDTLLKVFP